MPEQYSIAQYVGDLRRISAEAADKNEIFKQVGTLAKRLAKESSWIVDRFY
jgi:hypothetical protein